MEDGTRAFFTPLGCNAAEAFGPAPRMREVVNKCHSAQFMHSGGLGQALTFLPQPYHLLSGSRSSPSSSLLITRPRQGLIAPHTPRNYLALVLPKRGNVQATAKPRETTALFAAMDAKHPPDKHPKLQGNLWVYVGNLDWELPIAQVGR
jgi:hypothetical protein